jgi:SAM dependent carboxyl methyltransferase
MKEVYIMPSTTGMKGSGYYDRHSGAQLAAIRTFQGRVDDAVATMALPPSPQTVTVLDLGSSEGRNAIHLMAAIVAGLRRRTDQPLQTIYNDLPSNNFNQLFAGLEQSRLDGLMPEGVYTGVAAGSFYRPLLPPRTVHLATCLNAVHWLDQPPAVAPTDFVAYRRPLPARTGLTASPPEAAAAFRRQADRDLVQFLQCRAGELVPGAKLLVASPGDTDEVRLCDGLYDVLNDACLDLIAAGRMSRESYNRLTIPCYYRTVAEMIEPLQREESPLRGAFSIDSAEALEIPVPFVAEFRRGGDAAAYAEAYTGFLRAVSESVVRAALVEPAAIDWLYERIRDRLVAEPECYSWRYVLVAVQLTRR